MDGCPQGKRFRPSRDPLDRRLSGLRRVKGERRSAEFPAPNAGLLAYTITREGDPACASYDGRSCLWGVAEADLDFSRIKPLACGEPHRRLYGETGYENPRHWCNLALRRPRDSR